MANIRNSINLSDRMSPVLRSVMKSMDSALKAMKALDQQANKGLQSKAIRQAERDMQRANNEIIRMRNYTDLARNAADQNSHAWNSTANSVSNASHSVSSFLTGLASGVYLLKNLTDQASKLMKTADQAKSYTARIGLFNESEMTDQQVYGKVFSVAMGTRTDLDETANLVYKLLMSGAFGNTPDSTEQALGMASIINKALVAGGGTAEENARALLQLNQGLASGYLQGDELRSIREQAPYLARMLAEGLGKIDDKFIGTTIGDLKKLGSQGELTTDRIVRALAAMSPEITGAFNKMPKTFGQAMTSLESIWKYFLSLLYEGDGALAQINEKLWQFVDYLQTPQGIENLQMLATIFNIVVDVILTGVDLIGMAFQYLQEHSQIVQAAFLTLAVIAVVAAMAAMISWIAANWPLLLMIAIVYILINAFMQMGFTAQQIAGFIAGAIAFVATLAYDLVLLILSGISLILTAAAWLVTHAIQLVILLVQGIAQLVLWIVNIIYTVITAIWTALKTVGMSIKGGIQAVGGFIVDTIYNAASTVLSILAKVASAIDAIFGTNFSASVSSFTAKMDSAYTTVKGYLDAGQTFDDIGDMWAQFGEDTAFRWTDPSSDWNIYGQIADVWNGGNEIGADIWDLGIGLSNSFLDGTLGELTDPFASFDSGYDFGANLGDQFSALDLGNIMDNLGGSIGLDDLESMLANGLPVNGGDVDSVGKVKSDVDISDEDIKLLRDMAARDFLIQINTITPQMDVKFGDVRETADVGQIMEVLEEMVEEQMATALVEG